jgi:hypothetical protein
MYSKILIEFDENIRFVFLYKIKLPENLRFFGEQIFLNNLNYFFLTPTIFTVEE